jgi:hypothetical protein
MLKNYAVLMRDKTGDEGWTQVEGSSEANAKVNVMLRYGKGWRVAEILESKPFYQELYAGSSEDEAALLELRVANLKKGTSKPVITPLGEFPSVRDAAAAHNQIPQIFRKRLGVEEGFYFKTVDNNN